MKVFIDVPRPDSVDLLHQGHRGPFGPVIILLRALADIDEWQMRQRPYPPMYQAGIVYKPEPMEGREVLWMQRGRGREKGEHFKTVEELYRDKEGDCDDIAPARAAELRVRYGIPAIPCIKWRRMRVTDRRTIKQFGHKGPFWLVMMHVLVLLPDGRVEDPCVRLGMKGEYE